MIVYLNQTRTDTFSGADFRQGWFELRQRFAGQSKNLEDKGQQSNTEQASGRPEIKQLLAF